jgi:hypothetical protein
MGLVWWRSVQCACLWCSLFVVELQHRHEFLSTTVGVKSRRATTATLHSSHTVHRLKRACDHATHEPFKALFVFIKPIGIEGD